MLRAFVLTAGLALLMLPGTASALQPATPLPVPSVPAILLVQAQPAPEPGVPTNAWANARLAEINAAIATLEEQTRGLTAEARKQADDTLQTLRANRDAFNAKLATVAADSTKATEAQLAETRASLEASWTKFEADLESYLSTSGLALRNAVLQAREKAEELYWQKAIATLKSAEDAIAAEKRPAIDAAIAALQSYVDAAKAKLAKLQKAGNDAWAALQDSLADARRAFDNAYAGVLAVLDSASGNGAKP